MFALLFVILFFNIESFNNKLGLLKFLYPFTYFYLVPFFQNHYNSKNNNYINSMFKIILFYRQVPFLYHFLEPALKYLL